MNNELKCPNCGTVFQIDEQDYESIVKQIRDKEFEKEITIREAQFRNDKEQALKLAEAKAEKDLADELNKKYFVEVDKKKVMLSDAIKTLGVYNIEIKLFEGISGKIKVSVVAE